MNEEQKLKVEILSACGYNIEAARKCLDFVLSDNEVKNHEPDYILADGIYLIDTTGDAVRYNSTNIEIAKSIEYIGIVQGKRSLAIALHDVSKKDITLTANESDTKHCCYKRKYMDAVQDWDGNRNTERLEKIGLNPAILLKDDEYIPALAELYLICLNQKAINAAMRFVGGQELEGWYWSSIECSATKAWALYINSGNAGELNKTTTKLRVRLVKEFP